MDVLRPLLEAHPLELPRRRCRLLLGYAGWGPGQLDQELAASAWLSGARRSRSFVFATPAEEMWELAIRGLGVDPGKLHCRPRRPLAAGQRQTIPGWSAVHARPPG